MTPEKHIQVGDVVTVNGHEDEGERTVVHLYDQKVIPGGVRLDRAVGPDSNIGLFVSWNEDTLTVVRRKP